MIDEQKIIAHLKALMMGISVKLDIGRGEEQVYMSEDGALCVAGEKLDTATGESEEVYLKIPMYFEDFIKIVSKASDRETAILMGNITLNIVRKTK